MAQAGLNAEKTRGQKSRRTVPLSHKMLKIKNAVQGYCVEYWWLKCCDSGKPWLKLPLCPTLLILHPRYNFPPFCLKQEELRFKKTCFENFVFVYIRHNYSNLNILYKSMLQLTDFLHKCSLRINKQSMQ